MATSTTLENWRAIDLDKMFLAIELNKKHGFREKTDYIAKSGGTNGGTQPTRQTTICLFSYGYTHKRLTTSRLFNA
jgi:hypothetical protein